MTKGLEFNINGMYSQRAQLVVDTVKWNYNWYRQISIGLNNDPDYLAVLNKQHQLSIISNRNVKYFQSWF